MLDHFEKIIGFVKENGLNDQFFETAKEHLDAAGGLLKVNYVQTVLFALILERFGEASVAIDKIADIVKCSKIQLLKYMDDFEALKQKRLIRVTRDQMFVSNNGDFPEYTVPMDVINAVRNNSEYQYTAYDDLNPEEFFDCVKKLLNAARDDEINYETLKDEIEYIFSRNDKLTFVKKKSEYDLAESSVLLLLIFCCTLLFRDKEEIEADNLTSELNSIVGRNEARHILGRIKSGEHKLFKKGLVEFDCQNGLANTECYRLTQKTKDEFLGDLDWKKRANRRGSDFLQVKSIGVKKLFFSETIRCRINELTKLLRENNFSGIQKRLDESGMRTGFACLFSGPPGTGKTETVYQIARKTGRDIMLVDIAETKSMWYGESEKRIKAVFDRYRGVVKNGGLTPILLFNEADAVLGKRRELARSRGGPDQTENTIQNIILQEIENLNGILIATTNMTVNLDKAFERRFIYKIKFEKPDIESKKLMWKKLIPSLSDHDSARLAGEFDFSGGQIENIARKSTVSFILNGANPGIDGLLSFCREESLEKTVLPIGFRV